MKRIGKVLLMLLLVFGLTGCMKYNITLKVDKDGKVDAQMEVLAQESLFEDETSSKDEWLSDMQKQIKEKYKDAKIDFQETSKTIDNQKYVGGIFTVADQSQDKNIKKEEKDGKEILTLTLPLSDLTDEELSEEDLEGFNVSQLKSMGIEMNLIIEMPSKVTSTMGEVKDNTVTIDLLDAIYNSKAKDIVVSCELDSGTDMTMIIACVAGVVVIAGACWFILKKKKTAQDENVSE